VMTIWIFNCYGKELKTPMQALARFLTYFASFDWTAKVITVYGPVDSTKADMEGLPIDPNLFLPPTVFSDVKFRMEEYSAAVIKECQDEVAKAEAGLETSDMGNEMDLHTARLALSGAVSTLGNSSGSLFFRRGLINVMDPLAPNVSLTKSILDPRRFQLTRLAFRLGCAALVEMTDKCASLTAADMEKNSNADVYFVKSFLNRIMSTLQKTLSLRDASSPSKGGQEKAFSVLASTKISDLDMTLSVCELMLGQIIKPHVLMNVVTLILQTKGPLPVGEIGKHLQNTAQSTNLTKKIKSEFGGLKKAIETFEDHFTVGSEHPFNPTVQLTSGTYDDQEVTPQSPTRIALPQKMSGIGSTLASLPRQGPGPGPAPGPGPITGYPNRGTGRGSTRPGPGGGRGQGGRNGRDRSGSDISSVSDYSGYGSSSYGSYGHRSGGGGGGGGGGGNQYFGGSGSYDSQNYGYMSEAQQRHHHQHQQMLLYQQQQQMASAAQQGGYPMPPGQVYMGTSPSAMSMSPDEYIKKHAEQHALHMASLQQQQQQQQQQQSLPLPPSQLEGEEVEEHHEIAKEQPQGSGEGK